MRYGMIGNSYLVTRNVKSYNHSGKLFAGSYKVIHILTIQPSHFPPRYCLKYNENIYLHDNFLINI